MKEGADLEDIAADLVLYIYNKMHLSKGRLVYEAPLTQMVARYLQDVYDEGYNDAITEVK